MWIKLYPMPRVRLIIIALFLAAASASVTAEPKVDPNTGRIRTLFIGDPYVKPGYPTRAFIEDPKIELMRIPAEIGSTNPSFGKQQMERFLRLYLPRSRSDFLQNYDMVILTAIRSSDLKIEVQKWIKEGVEDIGMGFLMSDDPTSFGGSDTVWTTGPPWDPTPVGDILPVVKAGRKSFRDHNFRIKPVTDSPLTKGIPWEKMPLIWSHNRPDPKDGATILAVTTDETVSTDPKNDEVIIYWDYGQGRSLAFVWDWGGNGIVEFYRWAYWKDVLARLVYFPARAKIPGDVSLTHTLRSEISDYESTKNLVLSLIEFADTFGANINELNEELSETDSLRRNVDELWIDEEYEKCIPEMQEAMDSLNRVMQSALDAKDRALLWVYIVEWLTVAGTFILVGVAVWTLMIRRKLYRQVSATRFET